MGNVIRSSASGDNKIKDMRSTKLNADALGGVWQSIAETKLGPTLALLDKVEDNIAAKSQTALPLIAVASAEKRKADLLIGRVCDDAWNALGRPKSDPSLSVVFPGGFSYYTDGDVEDQPERMELLASLLASGIITKLPAATAQSLASEVGDGAKALRKALDTARAARTSLTLFEHMRLALSRSGHMELAGLKRLYKAHGFTEAQIHQVIPSRPYAPPKKAGASTSTPPKKEEAKAAAPAPKADAPAVAPPQDTEVKVAGSEPAPSPAAT